MQETNAQRSEFESKIEEFVHSNKNGKNLMKKWQSYERSFVLFTQNQWMYLRYLGELYRGRGMRVGLLSDP